jgi:hypothetical protein
MTKYVFFNTDRRLVYESDAISLQHTTYDLDFAMEAFITQPLEGYVANVYTFSLSTDVFNFETFYLSPEVNIATIADLVNHWNAQAVNQAKHTLSMSPDYATTDGSYLYLTNTAGVKVNLWAGTQSYIGSWEPYEIRRIATQDFISPIIPIIPSSPSSPIIVTQDLCIFEATSYLYRRRAKTTNEYYTKTEIISVPAGYYSDIDTFVAVLNVYITMRGERNGFVYHFITDGKGRLGIEATHRQPEPSVLTLKPIPGSNPCVLGLASFDEHVTLPLRTAKRIYFQNPMNIVM